MLAELPARIRTMNRARSVNRALAAIPAPETNLVLILPSTIGALELARALCARRECRVTVGPVTSEARWGLGASLRTPAQIVREFAGERRLNAPVISFPDQIAGEGESFVTLRFLGLDRRFSLLEAVLVLRHQPRVWQLRSSWRAGTFRLTRVSYASAMSAANHRTPPVRLLATLLAGLEAELADPPRDWLAARTFAIKSPIAFEDHMREELREVESLLRLAWQTNAAGAPGLRPALDSVCALLRTGHDLGNAAAPARRR
jgi:hypothetical protein